MPDIDSKNGRPSASRTAPQEGTAVHLPAPVVVMGVSGCGKSSVGEAIAAAFATDFIEGDALHPQENIAKMSAGTPLTDEDRWPWLDAVGKALHQGSDAGHAVVVSCSALKKVYRDHLRKAAGGRLAFVYLTGTRPVLESRMGHRTGHFMPTSLLDSQFRTLEPPTGEELVVTVDIDRPLDAVIAAALEGLADLRTA
ncbi:gluconate kinase (SKI family) [Rhizobium sp. PP-F2F-G38]|nr:gluconate kinase (SKI family) [Rhizobium sp. PP-WC-1G-195]PYE97119.1 gluconate kinase (SKI family) [Rhizobium sp. PP-F2F-G38]